MLVKSTLGGCGCGVTDSPEKNSALTLSKVTFPEWLFWITTDISLSPVSTTLL